MTTVGYVGTMYVLCAWCGKPLAGDKSALDVSHGICEECADIMMKEWRMIRAARVEPVAAEEWEDLWIDLGGEG